VLGVPFRGTHCESKITHLYLPVFQENVSGLEVSVDQVRGVDVDQRLQHLAHQAKDVWLLKVLAMPALQIFGAILHDDVEHLEAEGVAALAGLALLGAGQRAVLFGDAAAEGLQ
jgi:hypothetical protein